MGGPGASPGPMTLVSNFFSENEPDSEFRSFSQLLAGAMASPQAVPGHRTSFPAAVTAVDYKDKESGGGENDFRFNQNRPAGLMVAQPQMFAVPPGLSPATLLESSGWFSPGQVLKLRLAWFPLFVVNNG